MQSRLRIAAFVSHYHGLAVLEALLSLHDWIRVVVVVTDDPRCEHSNAANRLWCLGADDSLRNLVTNRSDEAGLPVYRGSIHATEFVHQFALHAPHAIVCSVFGQRIPESMLSAVNYRAYNLHPTVPGHGLEKTRGARAMEKIVNCGATELDITLHRMTLKFDCGEVLARSDSFPLPANAFDDATRPSDILDAYRQSMHLSGNIIRQKLLGILCCDFAQQFDAHGNNSTHFTSIAT